MVLLPAPVMVTVALPFSKVTPSKVPFRSSGPWMVKVYPFSVLALSGPPLTTLVMVRLPVVGTTGGGGVSLFVTVKV